MHTTKTNGMHKYNGLLLIHQKLLFIYRTATYIIGGSYSYIRLLFIHQIPTYISEVPIYISEALTHILECYLYIRGSYLYIGDSHLYIGPIFVCWTPYLYIRLLLIYQTPTYVSDPYLYIGGSYLCIGLLYNRTPSYIMESYSYIRGFFLLNKRAAHTIVIMIHLAPKIGYQHCVEYELHISFVIQFLLKFL